VDTVVKQHINLTNSSIEKMYKLEFDNGSIIEVTGNHKFLTNQGWVRVDELTKNHEILTPILEYSRFDNNTVKKIKALYETHKKN
jgi:intein/homing endonuclease